MGGATLVATCSARTGYFAGDYGMEPLWCSVTIGLRSYVDALGLTRHYCARHEEIVRGRWPERAAGRQLDLAAVDRPPVLVRRPSPEASDRCESGGHPGCTCSACF